MIFFYNSSERKGRTKVDHFGAEGSQSKYNQAHRQKICPAWHNNQYGLPQGIPWPGENGWR